MKMKMILFVYFISLFFSKQQLLRKTNKYQVVKQIESKIKTKSLLRQKKINQQSSILSLVDKKQKSYHPQSDIKNNRLQENECDIQFNEAKKYTNQEVKPPTNYYLQKLNLEYEFKSFKKKKNCWWCFWKGTPKEYGFLLRKMVATYFNVYENKGLKKFTVFDEGNFEYKQQLECNQDQYINKIYLGTSKTTKNKQQITQYIKIRCDQITQKKLTYKSDSDKNPAKEIMTTYQKECSSDNQRMFITDLTVQYLPNFGLTGIKYKQEKMVCPKQQRLNDKLFCVNDIQNCQIYKDNECNQCYDGWLLQNKKCYLKIRNCKSQKQDICDTCNDGYIMDSLKCAKQVKDCQIYADGYCSICNENYELIDQTCVKIIDNCEEMNIDGTCKSCNIDYVLSTDKNTCFQTLKGCISQVDDKCTECNAAFFLYNDVCSELIANCKEQKTDVLCKTCSDEYFESEGQCYKLIDKCQKYDKAECTECDEGYFTLQTSCNELSEGCATQNADGCLTCNVKYELKEDKCLYFIQNCNKFNDDKSACEICEDKYSLQNGLCLKEIDNCTIQIIDTCSECKDGYELAKNNRICQQTKKRVKKHNNKKNQKSKAVHRN